MEPTTRSLTAWDRHLAERMADPVFARAYRRARRKIAIIDLLGRLIGLKAR